MSLLVPGAVRLHVAAAWLADLPPIEPPLRRWPVVPLVLVGIVVLATAVLVVRRLRRRGPTDQA